MSFLRKLFQRKTLLERLEEDLYEAILIQAQAKAELTYADALLSTIQAHYDRCIVGDASDEVIVL
jgi:hypothetical protein